MSKILVVDDERAIRNTLKDILEVEGHNVDVASCGEEALELILKSKYDLVISDISMNNMSGLDLFDRVKDEGVDVQFIIISGYAKIPIAVELIKKGAYDVIEKPIDINIIITKIRGALERSKEPVSVKRKRASKTCSSTVEECCMIGESPKMRSVKRMIEKVAAADARVLIIGENGTGKELVAKSIHALSDRCDRPIVEVNCAAIPSDLIESEMFGHEKGSFTGAVRQKKGKFELANGGTLFLDEIGDMSLSAQAKVLRALQENKITPVGGDKDILVDVRIVAATNKNLHEEIRKGNFREDLYHRLSVVIMRVPPLRERDGDVRLLVSYFINKYVKAKGIAVPTVTEEALEMLESREWSGNIRQLSNVVERLLIFGDVIDADLVNTYAYDE